MSHRIRDLPSDEGWGGSPREAVWEVYYSLSTETGFIIKEGFGG